MNIINQIKPIALKVIRKFFENTSYLTFKKGVAKYNLEEGTPNMAALIDALKSTYTEEDDKEFIKQLETNQGVFATFKGVRTKELLEQNKLDVIYCDEDKEDNLIDFEDYEHMIDKLKTLKNLHQEIIRLQEEEFDKIDYEQVLNHQTNIYNYFLSGIAGEWMKQAVIITLFDAILPHKPQLKDNSYGFYHDIALSYSLFNKIKDSLN